MNIDPTETKSLDTDPIEFDAQIENSEKEPVPSHTKDTQSSFANDMGDYFDVFGAGMIGGVSFGLLEAYRRKHNSRIPPPPPPPTANSLERARRANGSSSTRSEEKRGASPSPLEEKKRKEYENKIRKMIDLLYSSYLNPRKLPEIMRLGGELRAEGNPFLFLQVLCLDDTMSIQMKTILANEWTNVRRNPFISDMKIEIEKLANPDSYIDLLSDASDKPVEVLRPFFVDRNWAGLLDTLFLS